MKNKECMLSTVDNPFDPFEQFDSWLMFDIEKGYNTCSKLARFTQNSDEDLTQAEISADIERAIDEIIKYDFLNIFVKVTRNVTEDEQTVLGDE